VSLDICEIFHSLQGESTFAGLPCVFIRLSGCNLDCTWCDTPYAKTESRQMSREQILEEVDRFECPLVEITGGEPLLQAGTPVLVSDLIGKGHQVLMETNGSISIAPVTTDCIRILDIKCPSSGEGASFLEKNYGLLTPEDEVKFVVGSREDYEFARAIIQSRLAGHTQQRIHLSPVFGKLSAERLAAWILEDNLPGRLSLQQHKLVWHPDQRGV